MTARERLEILQQISDIATLAGIRGEVNEECLRFEAAFELDDSRSQVVYVNPTEQSVSKATVVTFFSHRSRPLDLP